LMPSIVPVRVEASRALIARVAPSPKAVFGWDLTDP
jgi:hypothetical protein